MENIKYEDVKLEFRNDISGWVDANGKFWGKDDHIARWSNCTLIKCNCEGCESYVLKGRLKCSDCANKISHKKWEKSEKREASVQDEMYYSDLLDIYFHEWEEIEVHCTENGVEIGAARIYHCKRANAPSIDIGDIYCDITPEEFDPEDMINDEIQDLANKLNLAMASHPVNCFYPSKVAVESSPPQKR